MKIELKCGQCNSTLRLDGADAGKQARCPVCGNINKVPSADGGSKPSHSRDSAFDEPEPTFAGASARREVNAKPNPTFLGFDKRILYALGLGIASIIANFTCFGPIVGIPAAIGGLVFTLISASSLKQSGYVLNGIGLLIGGVLILLRYLF